MRKKTLTAILIIAVLILAAAAFVVYSYYTPNITINKGAPAEADTDRYFEPLMVSVSEKMGLPLPKSVKENLQTWTTEITKAMQEITTMPGEYHIESDVRIADNQTIVIFSGEATENGVAEEYYKELKFDFALTEDILF